MWRMRCVRVGVHNRLAPAPQLELPAKRIAITSVDMHAEAMDLLHVLHDGHEVALRGVPAGARICCTRHGGATNYCRYSTQQLARHGADRHIAGTRFVGMSGQRHAHTHTAAPHPGLCVLGMLRQAAWLLVHVGVRAAHLYLYSCSQRLGPHTASLQQPLASTRQAYQRVEMGKLADHSKVAVLRELLRCWAGKVWDHGRRAHRMHTTKQAVLVLLLAHPLVLHAVQRDVQACGFTVQIVGSSGQDVDVAAALKAHATAPPAGPCCVCVPSSMWPPHCTQSALHGA